MRAIFLWRSEVDITTFRDEPTIKDRDVRSDKTLSKA
jgi:hypothetical protein